MQYVPEYGESQGVHVMTFLAVLIVFISVSPPPSPDISSNCIHYINPTIILIN